MSSGSGANLQELEDRAVQAEQQIKILTEKMDQLEYAISHGEFKKPEVREVSTSNTDIVNVEEITKKKLRVNKTS